MLLWKNTTHLTYTSTHPPKSCALKLWSNDLTSFLFNMWPMGPLSDLRTRPQPNQKDQTSNCAMIDSKGSMAQFRSNTKRSQCRQSLNSPSWRWPRWRRLDPSAPPVRLGSTVEASRFFFSFRLFDSFPFLLLFLPFISWSPSLLGSFRSSS